MSPLPDIGWKVGFEIELMAPPGASRATLAAGLGGSVHPFWHLQSEPSKVPGMGVFHNLTPGFEVRSGDTWTARCVDDITLQHGLDRDHPAKPGWFRVVSDDRRLLQLVMRHGRADGEPMASLAPIAHLFGTQPTSAGGGMVRVADLTGSPVCMAAPLPGERERPTELVTAPISVNHHAQVASLLAPALDLGFQVAHEAAIHVHCDGAPLRDPRVFQHLVRLWLALGDDLRRRVRTNPACMRLGPWSKSFVTAALSNQTPQSSWLTFRKALAATELTKYCDLNVSNLVFDLQDMPTVEFRIFPGSMNAETITAFGHIAAAVCRGAVSGTQATRLEDLPGLPPAALALLEH